MNPGRTRSKNVYIYTSHCCWACSAQTRPLQRMSRVPLQWAIQSSFRAALVVQSRRNARVGVCGVARCPQSPGAGSGDSLALLFRRPWARATCAWLGLCRSCQLQRLRGLVPSNSQWLLGVAWVVQFHGGVRMQRPGTAVDTWGPSNERWRSPTCTD